MPLTYNLNILSHLSPNPKCFTLKPRTAWHHRFHRLSLQTKTTKPRSLVCVTSEVIIMSCFGQPGAAYRNLISYIKARTQHSDNWKCNVWPLQYASTGVIIVKDIRKQISIHKKQPLDFPIRSSQGILPYEWVVVCSFLHFFVNVNTQIDECFIFLCVFLVWLVFFIFVL